MSANAPMFTPEARARIVARVELGVPFIDAAQAAGLKSATAKHWLAKGRREGSGTYAEFAEDVTAARERARTRPGPLSGDEFREHLDQAIRAGSVQAMKLWADLFYGPPGRGDDDDLGF